MLVREKNIKGFNVLELIVVLTIVGIISAVAYPNFSEWTKERQVRAGATKVKSFMNDFTFVAPARTCLSFVHSEKFG